MYNIQKNIFDRPYVLAETIYHEIKAHVDINTGSQTKDHNRYGSASGGVFLGSFAPDGSTPAANFQNQLRSVTPDADNPSKIPNPGPKPPDVASKYLN